MLRLHHTPRHVGLQGTLFTTNEYTMDLWSGSLCYTIFSNAFVLRECLKLPPCLFSPNINFASHTFCSGLQEHVSSTAVLVPNNICGETFHHRLFLWGSLENNYAHSGPRPCQFLTACSEPRSSALLSDFQRRAREIIFPPKRKEE